LENLDPTAILKALSEPRRLELLRRVAEMEDEEGVTCARVLQGMDISQSTFAHHVAELIDAGLIVATPRGRCKMLTVDRERTDAFLTEIKKILGG
jgi:DNA-binding transcriptional ArsR family regulator